MPRFIGGFGIVPGFVTSTESTSDAVLQQQITALEHTPETTYQHIRQDILQVGLAPLAPFLSRLRKCLGRDVVHIQVLTLSSRPHDFVSVDSAVQFIASHDGSIPMQQFVRYEIVVRYSSGDEVRGHFQTKALAIRFLEKFNGR